MQTGILNFLKNMCVLIREARTVCQVHRQKCFNIYRNKVFDKIPMIIVIAAFKYDWGIRFVWILNKEAKVKSKPYTNYCIILPHF